MKKLLLVLVLSFASIGAFAQATACTPKGGAWHRCVPNNTSKDPSIVDLDSLMNVWYAAWLVDTSHGGGGGGGSVGDTAKLPSIYLPQIYSLTTGINAATGSMYGVMINPNNNSLWTDWVYKNSVFQDKNHISVFYDRAKDDIYLRSIETYTESTRSSQLINLAQPLVWWNKYYDSDPTHDPLPYWYNESKGETYFETLSAQLDNEIHNTQTIADNSTNTATGNPYLMDLLDYTVAHNDSAKAIFCASAANRYQLTSYIADIAPGGTFALGGANGRYNTPTHIITGGYVKATGVKITPSAFSSGLRPLDVGFIVGAASDNNIGSYYLNATPSLAVVGASQVVIYVTEINFTPSCIGY